MEIRLSELNTVDLNFVLSRTPKDVRRLLRENPHFYLAGGFIRATIAGERPNDIDILGPDKDKVQARANAMAADRHSARLHKTPNAWTLLNPPRLPVQFIFRWLYDDPARLVREFDFTIAQAVIWFEPDTFEPTQSESEGEVKGQYRSLCHPDFYADLASRRLVYTQPQRHEDAGGSMMRVRKFLERGYHIEADSLAKVLARLLSAMRPGEENGVRDLSDEVHTSFVLRGLLREVDPAVIVDGVEIVDEHQIGASEDQNHVRYD